MDGLQIEMIPNNIVDDNFTNMMCKNNKEVEKLMSNNVSDDTKTYVVNLLDDLIRDIELIPVSDFLMMIEDRSYMDAIINDMVDDMIEDLPDDMINDKYHVSRCIRKCYKMALLKKLCEVGGNQKIANNRMKRGSGLKSKTLPLIKKKAQVSVI